MEYYSPRRMKFPSKWVVLENLILRAVTQSEKDKKKKKCTFSHIQMLPSLICKYSKPGN